jgi:hypothetical protein
MTAPSPPYREPLRRTLIRNGTLALAGGAILTVALRRGVAWWPIATLLMLWPTLGGHVVEFWYLRWLRPRLPAERVVQSCARVAVWFVGGCVLAQGMRLTSTLLDTHRRPWWPAWWLGGLAFIGLELVVHALLYARRRPNFYDDRV